EAIHTWSLPAVITCPGRSALCERHCYARSGRYRTSTVRDVLGENLEAATEPGFEARMVREIRRRGVRVCRWHVSGDFLDAEYAKASLAVFRRCPRTKFYGYTRSWRVAGILPVLARMAALRNVELWFSCDAETGIPHTIPDGVKLCWLMTEEGDVADGVDLV